MARRRPNIYDLTPEEWKLPLEPPAPGRQPEPASPSSAPVPMVKFHDRWMSNPSAYSAALAAAKWPSPDEYGPSTDAKWASGIHE